MKTSLIFIILSLSFSIALKAQDLRVKTEISEITVYEQSAQVERTGKANLKPGTINLVFDDLPFNLDRTQVQFNGEGPFKVQSIYFTNKIDTLNKAELIASRDNRDYASEITELNKSNNEIQGRIEIYEREKILLEQHNQFKNSQTGVDLDQLTKATEYLRNKYLEIHKTLLELKQEIADNQTRVNDLNLLRNKRQHVIIEQYLQLNVLIIAKESVQADLRVSYQIRNAGWTPFYDARVENINQPVELSYQAKVYQNSGEDWNDVILTLASGKPQANQFKPDLAPWYIGQAPQAIYYQNAPAIQTSTTSQSNDPNEWLIKQNYNRNIREVSGQLLDSRSGLPLIGANIILYGTNQGTVTDIDGRYRLAVPDQTQKIQFQYVGYQNTILNISQPVMNVYLKEQLNQLNTLEISGERVSAQMISKKSVSQISSVAGVFSRGRKRNKKEKIDNEYIPVRASYSPTQVKFTADVPYTIKSSGERFLVHLIDYPIEADYQYSCSPKLDERAFLVARIIDWEFLDLLPGDMNVYFEESFVGQSRLDPTYADDTLNLSLGIDESIRIERTRIKTGYKRQILAGTRKDSREWVISIRNNKTADIKIMIDDQIPISQSEDVKVDLKEKSGAQIIDESGFLVWYLVVPAKENKDLKYKYEVSSPKDSYFKLD